MDQNLPTIEELRARGRATPGRQLTPEEAAAAGANKKKSPRRYGAKGEQWVKRRLETMIGADLRKRSDTVRNYTDMHGEERTYYRPAGYDYDGSAPMLVSGRPMTVPLAIEVKTFQGSFPISSLTDRQLDALTEARVGGKFSLVALVRHSKGVIECGWIIPFRERYDYRLGIITMELDILDWSAILTSLDVIAENDKRFRGKSLRPQDLERLCSDHLIENISGRWRLCPWLERVRVAEQVRLL